MIIAVRLLWIIFVWSDISTPTVYVLNRIAFLLEFTAITLLLAHW